MESASAELDDLKAEQSQALLRELFVNARIAWENGRWLDFLLRSIRFQQVALPLAVAKMPTGTFDSTVSEEMLRLHREMLILRMVRTVEQESATNITNGQRKQLAQTMKESYSLAEIRTLCFDSGVNFEEIEGETLHRKIEELILYFQRRQWLLSLVQKVREDRPEQADNLPVLTAQDEMAHIVQALRFLEAPRPLYEKTILTASSSGVSQKLLLQTYQAQAKDAGDMAVIPLDHMRNVCLALGISVQNPFRIIQEMLVDELQK